MTKIIRMAAFCLAAILVFPARAQALEVSARSAVLLDGDSLAVLWEKNPEEKSLIASTTKIMTALVTLENADLEEIVEIPPEAAGVEGSSMYLRPGERLSVRDLLHGLMLSSGNDAAVALAIHVGGSVPEFAEMMNRKAAELDLRGIHFVNPNGLDAEDHYGTALALGKLAAAAMENPEFRAIVSCRQYRAGERYLVNHNKLLWQYPGAVGVKTGYTKQAGRILVGAAERDGRRLISVTVGAPDDWNDHRNLLDYGFSRYAPGTLVAAGQTVGQLPVISGDRETIPLCADGTAEYPMLAGEKPEFRLLTPEFVYAPVEKGAVMGTLQIYVNQKLVEQMPVRAGAAAEQPAAPEPRWRRLLGTIGG